MKIIPPLLSFVALLCLTCNLTHAEIASPPQDSRPATPPQLKICTSCHEDKSALVQCDNKKWRIHTRKKSIDSVTSTLAETTYLGKACSTAQTQLKDKSKKYPPPAADNQQK